MTASERERMNLEQRVWTDTHSAPGGHRLAASDAELVGFFTAAVGVRAQQYEGSGGAFSSSETHTSRLKAMRWLAPGTPPSAMVVRDRVASSLSMLSPAHRSVLVAVYTPHAWHAVAVVALASPWGGGSLVLLASTLPRASEVARKRKVGRPHRLANLLKTLGHEDESERERPEADEVLGWLLSLAVSDETTQLIGRLRKDAEALRMSALEAYEVVRRARVEAEGVEFRARKEARRRRGEELLAEEIGMSRRIARARFERRTGRKVAA